MARPQQPPFGIREPVAVVHCFFPDRPAPFAGAMAALARFERDAFAPDSHSNDLFQFFSVAWRGLDLVVAVFPGESLGRLAATLAADGLALVRGAPGGFGPEGHAVFDTEACVSGRLGLRVGGRTYALVARGAAPSVWALTFAAYGRDPAARAYAAGAPDGDALAALAALAGGAPAGDPGPAALALPPLEFPFPKRPP